VWLEPEKPGQEHLEHLPYLPGSSLPPSAMGIRPVRIPCVVGATAAITAQQKILRGQVLRPGTVTPSASHGGP
jgi:hypothetical protein